MASSAILHHHDSRIIVKNMPPYVNEARLRDIFSQKGEVTDVKVCRTRSGKSRRFGFVGFASAKDARRARAFFHRSFLDTRQLSVDAAIAVGSSRLARPWSRYTRGSSAHVQLKPEKKRKRARGDVFCSVGAAGDKSGNRGGDSREQKRSRAHISSGASPLLPPVDDTGDDSGEVNLKNDASLSNMAYLRAKSLGSASGSFEPTCSNGSVTVGTRAGGTTSASNREHGAVDESSSGCFDLE